MYRFDLNTDLVEYSEAVMECKEMKTTRNRYCWALEADEAEC